jgi:HD-GYP domain-containing protein (c-di-GMP phosphodiesterase class II)
MGGLSEAPAARPPSEDALLEFAREQESNPVERPTTSRVLALAFVLVAVGALFLPSHRGVSAVAVLVSLFAYAAARQVQVEFTTFYLIPTEAVFVAMWFVLPPRALPLVVGAAMLVAELPTMLRNRRSIERTAVLNLASSWFAVGPAVVLYAWGTHVPRWEDVPIYLAALAAQFLLDFATTLLFHRAAVGTVHVKEHLRTFVDAAGWDAMLAPLGLLAAFVAYRHPVAILLLLPIVLIVARTGAAQWEEHTKRLELRDAYEDTSYLVGDLIELDDEYTGMHSRHLVELVLQVCDRMGVSGGDRQLAELTAILHDVGKIRIPKEIINKPGPLDDDERALMNTHTILGEELLAPRRGLLRQVAPIVRSCHEHWDGNGYPDGLAGEDISLIARIVCTCDAWSAMTTDRSYRRALSLEDAAAELRRCSGTQFDPAVVDALAAVLGL